MTVTLLITVIAAIIIITAVWKIHPLPVLLLGGFLFGVCNDYGFLKTLDLISAGFGNTIKSIGLVIIAGVIVLQVFQNRAEKHAIAK